MRLCKREFTPAKPWQHFCQPRCRDAFHNRGKTLAAAMPNMMRMPLRSGQRKTDCLSSDTGLDPDPRGEPPLVVKRRSILTVEDRRAAE